MEQTSNIKLIIGCAVAITSACLSSLGVNLQASSLNQERTINQIAELEHVLMYSGQWDSTSLSNIPESPERFEYSIWEILRVFAGYDDTDEISKTQARKRLWFRSQWYFGFGLYTLCQLFGSVIALGFISPIIFAPLGSIGLIFNIVFSSAFTGTKITRSDWVGTVFIVAGCAIVSMFGSKIPQSRQTIPDLIILFSRPAFIAYFSVELFIDLLILFLIKYLEYNLHAMKVAISSREISRRGSRRSTLVRLLPQEGNQVVDSSVVWTNNSLSPPPENLSSDPGQVLNHNQFEISSENLQGSLHESSPLIKRRSTNLSIRAIKLASMSTLVGVLYAILGGIIASVTLLLTKSGVELLIVSLFETENQFQGVFSFLLIAILLVTAVLQVLALNKVYFLNSALKFELPITVLPIFYTIFTCFSLVNTMVYMNTFGAASTIDIASLIFGMLCLIGGVWFMGYSKRSLD